MQITSVVTGLALLGAASAHTRFSVLFVDGVNQGDGTCIRQSASFTNSVDPVRPVTSADMACGQNGEVGVAHICPAKSGSVLTIEYRENPSEQDSASLDPPHKGPCAFYMKRVDDSSASNNAAGDGWFKIWEEGYDEENEIWCTDKMINNDGHLSVTIPDDLLGGYYLIRPELLALHNATNTPPDPQFYTSCGQIYLESSGTAEPETVNIGEGYYTLDVPGLTYDIYASPLSLPYPVPGPPVYKSGSSGTGKANVANTAAQALGLVPVGSVLTNANWDGIELDSYSDETGCWNASASCWNQSAVCYDVAPPTGSANCELWDDKCNALDDQCNAGNYDGPPDQGKDLNPTYTNLSGAATIFSMDPLAYSTLSDNYFTASGGVGADTAVSAAATTAASVASAATTSVAAVATSAASTSEAFSESAPIAETSASETVVAAATSESTTASSTSSTSSSMEATSSAANEVAAASAVAPTPAAVTKTVWNIVTEYVTASECEADQTWTHTGVPHASDFAGKRRFHGRHF